jgi:ribose-phosphate pyrophosphokinase
MAYDSLMVFTGNANPKLAADVVKRLNISLGRANVGRFSDGEVSCEILENVRGNDVFVLQSTCNPTNDNLMELMVMVDALKRASAGRITAAIPYFGYARQDRRTRSARVAITAKVVANMLQAVGVQRVLTVDLHADQIQGFFDIPVDNIYAAPILLGDIWKQRHDDLLVVSPDVGGVVRARALAKRLESDLAIIDKRRPKANVSEVMNIIGEVDGRTCVIMDDMVDTAGTLCKAAQALKEHGAKRVLAYCTHPCCRAAPSSASKARSSTNWWLPTPFPWRRTRAASKRIRQISIAELMAETMLRISNESSVSSLFMD